MLLHAANSDQRRSLTADSRRTHGRGSVLPDRAINRFFVVLWRHSMFIHHVVLTAAIAVGFIAQQVGAQVSTQRSAARFAATVVLVDSLPVPNARFLVQRRPNLQPADVILVQTDANPAEVSDAVRALLTARQASGDFPTTSATIRVRPQQARGAFPWSPQVLADLRRSARRNIAGVGSVRAVEIWLPSQAKRGGGMGRARLP